MVERTVDWQLHELARGVDPAMIRQDPNVFGDFLDPYYICMELNRTFGANNWSKKIVRMDCTHAEERQGQKPIVSYVCTLAIEVTFADGSVRHLEDVGGNVCTNQKNLAEAHDFAARSAVSNALKRVAKDLGPRLGLSLYDSSHSVPRTGTDRWDGYQESGGEVKGAQGAKNSPSGGSYQQSPPLTQNQLDFSNWAEASGIDIYALANWCEVKGWGKPSHWTDENRDGFIRDWVTRWEQEYASWLKVP